MKSLLAVNLLICSIAVTGAQAPIDGTWSGEIPNESGAQKISLSLTTEGDKLSGSVVGTGIESGIQEGLIAGATITFKAVQNANGAQQTVNCTGTILAEEIQMSCATEGAPALEFSVHRDTN